MERIDIDGAIRLHNQWRRQFLNAFAGGDYAEMPLSEHRSCTLASPAARPCPDCFRYTITLPSQPKPITLVTYDGTTNPPELNALLEAIQAVTR